MISINSICEWAGSNPSQRKFVEGERVFRAGHIIKCGKTSVKSDVVSFTAVCLQTSSLKENPHEIHGEVSTGGKIKVLKCSCKAGLGEKCKHIIAALLYIYQKGDQLEYLSCTDQKCQWKQDHKKAVDNYNAAPLMQHSCFSEPVKRKKIITASSVQTLHEGSDKESEEEAEENVQPSQNSPGYVVDETVETPAKKKRKPAPTIEVSESQLEEIKSLIGNRLPKSALAKHILGRHNTIVVEEKSNVSQVEQDVIKLIFEGQDSELMRSVQAFSVGDIQDCCAKTLDQLSQYVQAICEKTKNSYAHWMRERLWRITGSVCYGLYTYTKNKRSDVEWAIKCKNVFSPKDFKSESTEHGKLSESEARNAFRRKCTNVKLDVIEVGLIISKLNPWLAYSPDGVVLKDKKPVALLEIKCPLKGKRESINETVASQLNKCLIKKGENVIMKEKHCYYGQIQLGMAVLNLQFTFFVIYSSFDKKVFTLKVQRNDVFISTMLKALKKVYYSFRLHEICVERGHCDTTNKSVEKSDII